MTSVLTSTGQVGHRLEHREKTAMDAMISDSARSWRRKDFISRHAHPRPQTAKLKQQQNRVLFVVVAYFSFSFWFLRQDLMYSRLAKNSLVSKGWPWNSHRPTQELRLPTFIPVRQPRIPFLTPRTGRHWVAVVGSHLMCRAFETVLQI